MTNANPPLRQGLLRAVLETAGQGNCCSLYGLSNSGKSPLLRALPDHLEHYTRASGRPGLLVYIDCNRAVELTTQGFYEIVVRSLREALDELPDPAVCPPELAALMQTHHNQISQVGALFQASLAFNAALAEACTRLEHNLVLLLDEFDEVYAGLENRALLNLRALQDQFGARLIYLTATIRPLSESRSPGDNEFAELFLHYFPLGRLSDEDARLALSMHGSGGWPAAMESAALQLAGGHLGLLTALAQAVRRGARLEQLAGTPGARGECLKIWNQLRPDEQEALKSLVTEAQAGLVPPARERLTTLGLLDAGGQIFSSLFADFVRRQCAAPAQDSVGVTVDEDAGEVWVDGTRLTVLTDLEYRLMRLLHQRRDRLTTKDMIVTAVWGTQYFDNVDDARIEKLVSRLRAKVEPDPARPRYLLTQRGRGYKLVSRPADLPEEEIE